MTTPTPMIDLDQIDVSIKEENEDGPDGTIIDEEKTPCKPDDDALKPKIACYYRNCGKMVDKSAKVCNF